MITNTSGNSKPKTTKCPAISGVTAFRDVPASLGGLLLLASLLLLTPLLLQACPIYVPVVAVAVDPADVIAVVACLLLWSLLSLAPLLF